MKSAVILLKSITEANKAKKQLSNYRIKCSIEKVHARRGGCCYGIRVYSNSNYGVDTNKICRLLSIVNIYCDDVVE